MFYLCRESKVERVLNLTVKVSRCWVAKNLPGRNKENEEEGCVWGRLTATCCKERIIIE